MKTYEELVAWIKENVPSEKLGSETPEKAAIWWASYKRAEQIFECSVKDLARGLVDGYCETDEQEVSWQLDQYEDESTEDLVADLRRWFEIL